MAYTRTGYANYAAFPATGSASIIYVDLSNGNEYLWSTSVYVTYTGTQAGVRLGYQDAAWFAANPTFLLGKGQSVYLLQTGTYKIGDGVTALSGLSFLGGSAYTEIEETFTISGSSQVLTHAPIGVSNHYIEGQRATLGQRIVSIVGNLITFDADYTGLSLTSVYKY